MATSKKAAAAPQEAEAPKKAPAKKTAAAAAPAAAPAAEPEAGKRKPNAAFMKPLTPSKELGAIVGKKALPRTEVTKKVWEYIKKHNLQDATQRTLINADAKLKAVLGKDQVTMFEMTKLISVHLK